MDIKQLLYFTTIVECKNISTAAKKLYMSQPPLSNQMSLLENELGIKLFDRGNREITLTDAGKLFYERAKAIIELADSTKKEIIDIKEGIHGSIRIGVTSSLVDYFIKFCLSDFNNENIKIEIIEGNSYNLIEKLNNKEIELAIIRSPFTCNLDKIKLKSEHLFAVGLKFDNNEDISLELLANSKLIIHKRWYPFLEESFLKSNLKLKPLFIAEDARTCLKLALQGHGITILPKSIIESNDVNENYIREINNLDFVSHITLIYNSKNYTSCATKYLIDHIKTKITN